MKFLLFTLAALMAAGSLRAQPSFVGPAPVPAVLRDESLRRAAYQARIDEVLTWRASLAKPGDPATFGLSEIGAKLALRQDAAACSERLIELMKAPAAEIGRAHV